MQADLNKCKRLEKRKTDRHGWKGSREEAKIEQEEERVKVLNKAELIHKYSNTSQVLLGDPA